MRAGTAVILALGLTSGGCATIPNVATGYYLPRTDLTVTVTRTVGCTKRTEGRGRGARTIHTLYSTAEAAWVAAYSADPAARHPFNLAALNSPLADGAITFDFYDDGRLKSVNSTTTGRGAEVVQAVANLVPMFAFSSDLVGATSADARNVAAQAEAACAAITAVAGEGKTVSLVYDYIEDFEPRPRGARATDDSPINCRSVEAAASAGTQECIVAQRRLIPLAARSSHLALVDAALRPLCVEFTSEQLPEAVEWDGNSRNAAVLHLRQAARFRGQAYEVRTDYVHRLRAAIPVRRDDVCGAGEDLRTRVGAGRFLVPLTRSASQVAFNGYSGEFDLPVPRGAPFGSNNLKLALAESGAIQTLGYGSVSGTASALGAAGTIANAMTDTDAEQADRIAQQQRLIRCQQDATTCE